MPWLPSAWEISSNHPIVDTDLELCSEPELDDLILVELTPDVQHTEDHWIHQQLAMTVTSITNVFFLSYLSLIHI